MGCTLIRRLNSASDRRAALSELWVIAGMTERPILRPVSMPRARAASRN